MSLLLLFVLSSASAQYTPTAVFQTCPNSSAISQAGSSGTIIAGVAGKRTYICALYVAGSPGVLGQAVENVSIVGGTGTTCATRTYAIMGGTTGAAGMNMSPGVPIVLWSPTVTLSPPSAALAGDDVCLYKSGTGRLAGIVTWVQY